MESMTSNPNRFAAWFNMTYQGAYRSMTIDDIRDLTECGLIHRHGYYSASQDGETIRGVLQYEQKREKRFTKQDNRDEQEPAKCRMCGQPLTPEPERKKGRPKEYCFNCESYRATERYRKWRKRKKRLLVKSTSGGV